MKVIGYGIVGQGEAGRYMEATLKEFKRLCDNTILLVNAKDMEKALPEVQLIRRYGFQYVFDDREWGINQWRIKEDFVKNHVSKLAQDGDKMVCLNMDEVFDPVVTREKILALNNGPSWVVYIINLWDNGWNEDLSFWNVRIWEWNTKYGLDWERKPVHCGLAPLWARQYVCHAPFILLHYGLKDREDRLKKWDRYQKYDPRRSNLPGNFYDRLRRDNESKPFNQAFVRDIIEKDVIKLQQKRKEVRGLMTEEFVRLRRKDGNLEVSVEKKLLDATYGQRIKTGEFSIVDPNEEAPKNLDPQPAPVTENVCVICGKEFKTAKSLETHKKKFNH